MPGATSLPTKVIELLDGPVHAPHVPYPRGHCLVVSSAVSGEVGIDPALSSGDTSELEKAIERADKLGIELEGVGGVLEELPFEANSFDAVVSTFVFCSVRDPVMALREVTTAQARGDNGPASFDRSHSIRRKLA